MPVTAGYSGTPLPKKLGMKPGQVVGFVGLPEDLAELAGAEAFAAVDRAHDADELGPLLETRMNQQNRDVGRGNAGEAARLANRRRLEACQYLPCLRTEAGDNGVVKTVREAPLLVPPYALHFKCLAVEVAAHT